jgi:hypothetical protein
MLDVRRVSEGDCLCDDFEFVEECVSIILIKLNIYITYLMCVFSESFLK